MFEPQKSSKRITEVDRIVAGGKNEELKYKNNSILCGEMIFRDFISARREIHWRTRSSHDKYNKRRSLPTPLQHRQPQLVTDGIQSTRIQPGLWSSKENKGGYDGHQSSWSKSLVSFRHFLSFMGKPLNQHEIIKHSYNKRTKFDLLQVKHRTKYLWLGS